MLHFPLTMTWTEFVKGRWECQTCSIVLQLTHNLGLVKSDRKKGLKSNLLKVHDRELNFPDELYCNFSHIHFDIWAIGSKIIHSHYDMREHIWTMNMGICPNNFWQINQNYFNQRGLDYAHQLLRFDPTMFREFPKSELYFIYRKVFLLKGHST